MNIDFRVVRVWLEKWETSNDVGRTASQIAAVMLAKMLAESEKRILRLENLMKETCEESRILKGLERLLVSRPKPRRGLDKGTETKLTEHRRRMAAILSKADELLKAPREDHSIKAGGLVLEINRQESLNQAAKGM
jgi:hypothetical protein